MSAILQNSSEPAVGAVAAGTPQSHPTSPPEPAPMAAEHPPPQRPGLLLRMDRAVRNIAPWGIVATVAALLLSVVAFLYHYSWRIEERRVQALQLVNTAAPGYSGKKEAVEYLNRPDGLFCGEDGCLITMKRRNALARVDLSNAFLHQVQLPSANLITANLSGADMYRANLSGANLSGAILTKTNLSGANLSGADLAGTNLSGANLTGANLDGAEIIDSLIYLGDVTHLSDATDLRDVARWRARRLILEQLDKVCSGGDTEQSDGAARPPC